MNILVIEDDPTDRKLATVLLQTSGHVVRELVSGEDALKVIAPQKPDLILLDMQLPGINGRVLVEHLKNNPETWDIPIVAVTAFPDRFKKSELLAAGCDAYLTKPINTRTLPQKLAELVGKKSGAA